MNPPTSVLTGWLFDRGVRSLVDQAGRPGDLMRVIERERAVEEPSTDPVRRMSLVTTPRSPTEPAVSRVVAGSYPCRGTSMHAALWRLAYSERPRRGLCVLPWFSMWPAWVFAGQRRRRRPGIPDEFVEDVFQPGFRTDHRDGHAGAGLGLALARRLARSSDDDVLIAPAQQALTAASACHGPDQCLSVQEYMWPSRIVSVRPVLDRSTARTRTVPKNSTLVPHVPTPMPPSPRADPR